MPSYSPSIGEFENRSSVSLAPTVCVSRAFVYDEVNVKKFVIDFCIESPSYSYAQVSTELTLLLLLLISKAR